MKRLIKRNNKKSLKSRILIVIGYIKTVPKLGFNFPSSVKKSDRSSNGN